MPMLGAQPASAMETIMRMLAAKPRTRAKPARQIKQKWMNCLRPLGRKEPKSLSYPICVSWAPDRPHFITRHNVRLNSWNRGQQPAWQRTGKPVISEPPHEIRGTHRKANGVHQNTGRLIWDKFNEFIREQLNNRVRRSRSVVNRPTRFGPTRNSSRGDQACYWTAPGIQ